MSDFLCTGCGAVAKMSPGAVHMCDDPLYCTPIPYVDRHTLTAFTQSRPMQIAFTKALEMEKRAGRETAIICMGLGFIMGVLVSVLLKIIS